MIRFVMVLLAVISLGVAPYMATAHGADMAAEQAGTQMHHQPADRNSCDSGGCAAQVACFWVCSGLATVNPGVGTGPNLLLKSNGHALPPNFRGNGIVPPQDDPPPIFL